MLTEIKELAIDLLEVADAWQIEDKRLMAIVCSCYLAIGALAVIW